MMSDDSLCPFSKPIIGGWCQCPYAGLAERCSGKMSCAEPQAQRPHCVELVDQLRRRSRFVLGLSDRSDLLTHAQLMKIRCGGLLGMQRMLQPEAAQTPSVVALIDAARRVYGDLGAFPFSDIVPDMQAFSHRKRKPAPLAD